MRTIALGVAGAVAGAVVGVFLSQLVATTGVIFPLIPGLLTGAGAWLARPRGLAVPVISAVLGAAAGVVAEWWIAPFQADPGLGYFLRNLTSLPPVTLLLLGAGAALAFWVPWGRHQTVRGA